MTIFGAGNMVGGPLSGWLADHHGWQFAFWIQVSGRSCFEFIVRQY